MLRAVRRHDYAAATALGARLQALADVIFAPPVTDYRARTKMALAVLDVLDGVAVRPPLLPIGVEEHETIRKALQAADLLAAVEA
jgi:dihydrodipicolinate synthase/N-acetylneuraminate lyase